jgi:hypothetical protein
MSPYAPEQDRKEQQQDRTQNAPGHPHQGRRTGDTESHGSGDPRRQRGRHEPEIGGALCPAPRTGPPNCRRTGPRPRP